MANRRPHFFVTSSHVYRVAPQSIRDAGCEIMVRTEDNAFASSPQLKHLSQAERSERYRQLRAAMEAEGWDWREPLVLQMRRLDDKQDAIVDGHHRLAIAIELQWPTIPVRFVF